MKSDWAELCAEYLEKFDGEPPRFSMGSTDEEVEKELKKCINRGKPYGIDDLLTRLDKMGDSEKKFDELVDAYTAYFGETPDTWVLRGLPVKERNRILETCIKEDKEQETPYDNNPNVLV